MVAIFSLTSCQGETKESKLKSLRDELVETKAKLAWYDTNALAKLAEDRYESCLGTAAEREEPKGKCEEDKQRSLSVDAWLRGRHEARLNEIRKEIQELGGTLETSGNSTTR
jgi:hypothetical protein